MIENGRKWRKVAEVLPGRTGGPLGKPERKAVFPAECPILFSIVSNWFIYDLLDSNYQFLGSSEAQSPIAQEFEL